MAEDWSHEEVSATVANYLILLERELNGQPFNKAEERRRLVPILRNRTEKSIEWKCQNVSAVLQELGFPFIDGYKPAANYQKLLVDEVAIQLAQNEPLRLQALMVVEAIVRTRPATPQSAAVFVDAPVRKRNKVQERRNPTPVPRVGVNYIEIEARNSSLGQAGELFALDAEHRRLWEAGEPRLADRIEHASRVRGDGLGYDIASFEVDGRERLIEVKTTNFGRLTPFYASKREVEVSEELASRYCVYRVFKFRETPQIFSLPGSLRQSALLDPSQYRASIRAEE